MSRDRGMEFKELQRETYDRLYRDLDFALYKVDHPFRKYFEHHIVSLALAAGSQEIRIEECSFCTCPFRVPILAHRRLGFLVPPVGAVETLIVKTPLRRYANYLVFDASS